MGPGACISGPIFDPEILGETPASHFQNTGVKPQALFDFIVWSARPSDETCDALDRRRFVRHGKALRSPKGY